MFFNLSLAKTEEKNIDNSPVNSKEKKNDSRNKYSFIFDNYISPYSSSSILISAREGLNEIFDDKEKHIFRYEISILNNFINDIMMLISHEINGHGFRIRTEKGLTNTGYGFKPFLYTIPAFITPAGGLSGYTQPPKVDSEKIDKNSVGNINFRILNLMAGNEANTILANKIIMKNFQKGKMYHSDYNLFCKAFSNLFGYVLASKENGNVLGIEAKGDIMNYIEDINRKYYYNEKKDYKINLSDLQKSALIFCLNPIAYISIYAWYKNIFDGQKEFIIPHFSIKNIKYMPIIRMALTPFGINYHIDNFISINKRTFLLNFNYGKSPFYDNAYFGSRLETNDLIKFKIITLDLIAAIWYQPELIYCSRQTSSSDISENINNKKYGEEKFKYGFLFGPSIDLQITKNFSLNLQSIYKSRGFIEGESVYEGLTFRGGFSVHY